LCTL